MATFHLSAKVVSRGKGQSAVAKAAYNSRSKIEQELTGKVNDYSRKGGVLFSGIFAPKDAPEWAHDRAKLWNEVERFEKRKDAQLAREVEISLPHELTDEQRRQLVTDFVREQFQRKGMVADVNIHAPDRKGDDRNYHAHILLTMREIGPDGFGPKVREWNSKEQLEKWREGWERTANRYLERHGFEPTLDRRTLEAQGIDREPTKHRGVNVQGMERRGFETEIGNAYRDVAGRNNELYELRRTAAAVDRQIAEALREQEQSRVEAMRETLREADRLIAEGLRPLRDRDPQAALEQQREQRREQERAANLERWKLTKDFEKQAKEQAAPFVPSPHELRGTRAAIWECRTRSDSAKGFQAALNENGISLAQVTKDEAREYAKLADHFEGEGRYVPRLREGEFVAVGKNGQLHRLTPQTTGREFKETQEFLRGNLEPHSLPGLHQTQAVKFDASRQEREQRRADIEQRRAMKRGLRGPRGLGMMQQQEWATQEAKRREQERAQQQRHEMREAQGVDTQRFRADPDYRRELMAQHFQRFTEQSNEQRREQTEQLKETREWIQTRQR